MYAENLEAAEEVIRRLFDPRRTYKKAYICLLYTSDAADD